MFRYQFQKAVTKVQEDGSVHAVVSSERRDRDGDIIRVAGWDLDAFNRHPVLVAGHDYRNLSSQIGMWKDMSINNTNKTLEGVAVYWHGEGNPNADWGYKLATDGQAAFSVGFLPDVNKATVLPDGDKAYPNFEFNGQELLEVSHVIIPSNSEAIQAMKALQPDMRSIIEQIVAEIQAKQDGEAKSLVEIQIKELAEAVVTEVWPMLEEKFAEHYVPPTPASTPSPNLDDLYYQIARNATAEAIKEVTK
jgi:hypothetical protein